MGGSITVSDEEIVENTIINETSKADLSKEKKRTTTVAEDKSSIEEQKIVVESDDNINNNNKIKHEVTEENIKAKLTKEGETNNIQEEEKTIVVVEKDKEKDVTKEVQEKESGNTEKKIMHENQSVPIENVNTNYIKEEEIIDADILPKQKSIENSGKGTFDMKNISMKVEPEMLHVNRGYTSDTTHMAIHHSQQHHREIQPQYHHRYESHQPIVNFNAHLNDHRHHMYHQPVTHHRQLHHHQSSLMMPAQQYHHNGYHQTTNQHRVLVPITENHGYYHPQQQQQQQQQYLEQPHSPEWSPVSTPQKVSHASPMMRQHDNTAFVNNISDDKNNNEEDKGINCETIRIMLDGMTTLYKNGLQNYY